MLERFPLWLTLAASAWVLVVVGAGIGAAAVLYAASPPAPRPPALCKPAARASSPVNAIPFLVAPVFRRP